MVTKQSMRGRDFDTRGAITYTFSGRVIETQPIIPAPPSPEPPVTPKVIATVNVVDESWSSLNRKIVGVVTDAESGDSTLLYPKSFEVDGVQQSLDSIVEYGYYDFKTTGEHTIIYEFDDPTRIKDGQFNYCYLDTIIIPSCITSIGNYAFSYSCGPIDATGNATIPDSVTSIGDGAFDSCYDIITCTIPSGITNIGDDTFNGCQSLTSITVPSGVTSIGSRAFSNCESLTSITINATTPPTLGRYAFDYTNNCPIYVPSESVQAYKTAWSAYADRIQAIS